MRPSYLYRFARLLDLAVTKARGTSCISRLTDSSTLELSLHLFPLCTKFADLLQEDRNAKRIKINKIFKWCVIFEKTLILIFSIKYLKGV